MSHRAAGLGADSICGSAAMLVLLSLMLIACASKPQVVDMSGTWPESPGGYHDTTSAWTRHGVVRDFPDQLIEVFATFKSPEWRAAQVAHIAELRDLDPASYEGLVTEAQTESQGQYEIVLLVSTHDRAENNLDRGDRAAWQVELIDSEGNRMVPVDIERDRRPREVVRAELPHMNDFATSYILRFPRTYELLGPNSNKVLLRVSGSRGAVELVWQ